MLAGRFRGIVGRVSPSRWFLRPLLKGFVLFWGLFCLVDMCIIGMGLSWDLGAWDFVYDTIRGQLATTTASFLALFNTLFYTLCTL